MSLTALMLDDAEADVASLASVVNGAATDPDVVTRLGIAVKPLAKVIADIETAGSTAGGYEPAVAYAAGINIVRTSQTVEYLGTTYAPLATAIPFVTGAGFDPTKWKIIIAKQLVTRAQMKAATPANGDVLLLVDGLKTGPFKFNSANIKTLCDADATEGLFIKPTGGDGTAGAWVRLFDHDANANWWGFTADDNGGASTDNAAVLTAAVAALKAIRTTGGHVSTYGTGASPGLLIIGAGYVSAAIAITHSLRVCGISTGLGSTGTQLRWPVGTHGFDCGVGSSGSAFERMSLIGGWTNGDEGEFHAIHTQHGIIRRDLFISNWQGDGLHDDADASSSGGANNANQDLIERVFVQNCRRAFHCNGGDVNSKQITGLLGIQNRQAGIYELGFLGNGYSHVTTESNGFYPGWGTGAANRPVSYVRDTVNGKVWACVGGQEAWCATHAPPTSGVSNQGWVLHAGWATNAAVNAYAGFGVPDWFNGITVRPGGGVIHQGDSNRSTFEALYSEGNQHNQFDANVGKINGNIDNASSVIASAGLLLSGTPPIQRGFVHNYSLNIAGNQFIHQGTQATLGPQTTTGPFGVADNLWQWTASNLSTALLFQSLGGGALQTDGSIISSFSTLSVSGKNLLRLQVNGVTKVQLDNTGLYPLTDNALPLGGASNRWSTVYAGTGTINTSDERHKAMLPIDDAALDAWGDVEWSSFQFRDAIESKGDGARIHHGLVAQRIEAVFRGHGLDPFRYGLLCHDSWEDQYEHETETVIRPVEQFEESEVDDPRVPGRKVPVRIPVIREVEVEQAKRDEDGELVMRLARKAGDIYGVRENEAFAIEAAFQRRRADRIEARLEAIEKALQPPA